MSDDSDGQLIERCRHGDTASWEALVNRYSALVYSIPRRYRLPTSDCDDVHQAVFAALVTGIANLKNLEALPKWLMTSAHRETWRVSRARSRLVDTDCDFVSVSEPQESLVEELEQVAIVRRALAELGLEKAVAYLVEYDTLAAPTGRAFDANIMRPPTAEERALQERARRDNDEELRAQIQRARQDRERGDREQLREMQKW